MVLVGDGVVGLCLLVLLFGVVVVCWLLVLLFVLVLLLFVGVDGAVVCLRFVVD